MLQLATGFTSIREKMNQMDPLTYETKYNSVVTNAG